MRYLSLFSGIEAASLAWEPLGMEPAAFAEVDPFCCALLAQRWPGVPNLGDVTRWKEWPDLGPVHIIVGGSPCQSFSLAGMRMGMDDPRGQLTLAYLAVVSRYRPRWVVWENVPGVLSADGGRAFGSFLGGLAELGYGWAYRTLDAQHFGVPQRRRRVFVVGYLGDWRPPVAVLFEHESLSGHPAPGRTARQGSPPYAGTLSANGSETARSLGNANELDFCVAMGYTPSAHGAYGEGCGPLRHDVGYTNVQLVAHSLRTEGADASEDGTGCGTPRVIQNPPTFWDGGQICQTLDAVLHKGQMMPEKQRFPVVLQDGDECGSPRTARSATAAGSHGARNIECTTPTAPASDPRKTTANTPIGEVHSGAEDAMQVRRLTPRECERLQGMPDDHTLVEYRSRPAADSPRYRAIGNSMAVPVMAWIGKRLLTAEDVIERKEHQ